MADAELGGWDLSIYDPTLMWAAHPTDGFVLAKIGEKNAKGECSVSDPSGKTWMVKETEVFPLEKSDLESADDLANLKNLHEASLLHNVKKRYKTESAIYTYTGPGVLIALNPYQQLDLYTPEKFQQYRNRAIGELPPHLFAVADTTYRELCKSQKSQSVIISGESGSGKTESTKLILRYLANVSEKPQNQDPNQVSVEVQIVESGPLLEAFGNAKTVRNNNSSRFGKFIKVQYNRQNQIVGANIMHSLLEKSRLVSQSKGERNYHIFYQLCAGASAEDRAKYQIRDAMSYRYLNQGEGHIIKGVDDAEDYHDTLRIMGLCGITASERDATVRILAAIMHMGDLEFVNDGAETAAVKDTAAANFVASLLSVSPSTFIDALTKRTIVVGSERTSIPLKAEQAASTRDAFAKAIYSFLFDWLIGRINATMASREPSDCFVGVLDIFGFEIFENNSLEQFFINFANEALQQQFNNFVFKLEQKEYAEEEIDWASVSFVDNDECLALIDKKLTGVLSILEEQCMFPKATDQTFLDKVNQTHDKHPYFNKQRLGKNFGVKHFAGPVVYNVDGFLVKNADKLNDDAVSCVKSSSDAFLKSLFEQDAAAAEALAAASAAPAGRAGVGKSASRVTTVGGYFRKQLAELVATLSATAPQYVRCIKPNTQKSAMVFDPVLVQLQLRCAGVLETIRIRRAAYPVRLPHSRFLQRYSIVTAKSLDMSKTQRERAQWLMTEANCELGRWQVGKSKVFMRLDVHQHLEKLREAAMSRMIVVIQKNVRMYIARKEYKRSLELIFRVQMRVRRWVARTRFRRLRKACITVQKFVRRWIARKRYLAKRSKFIVVQSLIRKHLAVNAFRRARKAIIVFQSALRALKARRALTALKNERAERIRQEELRRKKAEDDEKERIRLERLRREEEERERLRQEMLRQQEEEERKQKEEQEKQRKDAEARRKKEAEEREAARRADEAARLQREQEEKARSAAESLKAEQAALAKAQEERRLAAEAEAKAEAAAKAAAPTPAPAAVSSTPASPAPAVVSAPAEVAKVSSPVVEAKVSAPFVEAPKVATPAARVEPAVPISAAPASVSDSAASPAAAAPRAAPKKRLIATKAASAAPDHGAAVSEVRRGGGATNLVDHSSVYALPTVSILVKQKPSSLEEHLQMIEEDNAALEEALHISDEISQQDSGIFADIIKTMALMIKYHEGECDKHCINNIVLQERTRLYVASTPSSYLVPKL